MSEFDDFRDQEGKEVTEAADEAPQLFYGSSDEFVREHLIHMYSRRVGPGNASFRWAADWWNYPKPSPASKRYGAPGSTYASTAPPDQAPGGSNTPTTTCPSS